MTLNWGKIGVKPQPDTLLGNLFEAKTPKNSKKTPLDVLPRAIFGKSDQKRWDEGPKKMQRTPSRRPTVGGRVGGQVLKKVKILIENSHFGTARKFRFRLTFLSHLYFFSHQNLYLMICVTADSFFQNKDVFPMNQFKLNLLLARFFY